MLGCEKRAKGGVEWPPLIIMVDGVKARESAAEGQCNCREV